VEERGRRKRRKRETEEKNRKEGKLWGRDGLTLMLTVA